MGWRTAIDAFAERLRDAVSEDQCRPDERRADPTATAVFDGGRFIVVSGSAHQMKESFKKLLRERPEMLSVIQEAIKESFIFAEH